MKRKRKDLEKDENSHPKKRKIEENKQTVKNKSKEYLKRAKKLLEKDENDEKALDLLSLSLEESLSFEALYLRAKMYRSKEKFSRCRTDIEESIKRTVECFEYLLKGISENSSYENNILTISNYVRVCCCLFMESGFLQIKKVDYNEKYENSRDIMVFTNVLEVLNKLCLFLEKKECKLDDKRKKEWFIFKFSIISERGKNFFFNDQYDDALNDLSKSKIFFEQKNNIKKLKSIYFFIGTICVKKKLYRMGLLNLEKCKKIFDDNNGLLDEFFKRLILFNLFLDIGTCFLYLNQYLDAIKSLEKVKSYTLISNIRENKENLESVMRFCVEKLKSKIFKKNIENF